jgi:hypothetical protein
VCPSPSKILRFARPAQMAFVQMLTNAVPSQYVEGQGRASQHYWREVLRYAAQGTASPYWMNGSPSRRGFQWLSDPAQVSDWTNRLQGMVGVSAGMHPHVNFPNGNDFYRANNFDIHAENPTGGSNPDFLFHLPSAYSFEPELPGLRQNLIRMWDAGLAMWRVPVNIRIRNAYGVGPSRLLTRFS